MHSVTGRSITDSDMRVHVYIYFDKRPPTFAFYPIKRTKTYEEEGKACKEII